MIAESVRHAENSARLFNRIFRKLFAAAFVLFWGVLVLVPQLRAQTQI